jgi:hypothetical protein
MVFKYLSVGLLHYGVSAPFEPKMVQDVVFSGHDNPSVELTLTDTYGGQYSIENQ